MPAKGREGADRCCVRRLRNEQVTPDRLEADLRFQDFRARMRLRRGGWGYTFGERVLLASCSEVVCSCSARGRGRRALLKTEADAVCGGVPDFSGSLSTVS